MLSIHDDIQEKLKEVTQTKIFELPTLRLSRQRKEENFFFFFLMTGKLNNVALKEKKKKKKNARKGEN
jgi:predicted CopG family antitoxin